MALESKELPTTWPRLLMLVAKEAASPGRRTPRLRTVLFSQIAAKGCAVRVDGLANNLVVAVNGVGYGARSSEVRKRGGSAVFPHYGVIRCGAGSRVAYGLAVIVDAECDPVWIVTDRRKRLGFAFVPQHRQVNPIVSDAGRAGGVHDTIFRISYDLSAVIDGAGLPVIPAQRRESAA